MQEIHYRNEQDRYDIAMKLREIRTDRGMSQNRLAELTGMDPKQVCRHENAEHDISSCTLLQYAEALGVSPLALMPERFSGEEDRKQRQICQTLKNLTDDNLQIIQMLANQLQKTQS